jgi:hypothetical protein
MRQISHRHHLTLSDVNGTLLEVFISSASYVSEQGGELSNCLDGFICVNTLVFHEGIIEVFPIFHCCKV